MWMFEVVYERFGEGGNFYVSTTKTSFYAVFVSYLADGALFSTCGLPGGIGTN